LMKDATAGSVRKLRDGAGGTVGAFLWEPSLTQGLLNGTPSTFLGSPVYTDPNCTAGTNVQVAVYGDFSTYAVRTVGNPVIDRDDSIGFKEDSVWYRGKWSVDGDHRDVSAFGVLKQTASSPWSGTTPGGCLAVAARSSARGSIPNFPTRRIHRAHPSCTSRVLA
jgi:HK97 family phage major capsid protein